MVVLYCGNIAGDTTGSSGKMSSRVVMKPLLPKTPSATSLAIRVPVKGLVTEPSGKRSFSWISLSGLGCAQFSDTLLAADDHLALVANQNRRQRRHPRLRDMVPQFHLEKIEGVDDNEVELESHSHKVLPARAVK